MNAANEEAQNQRSGTASDDSGALIELHYCIDRRLAVRARHDQSMHVAVCRGLSMGRSTELGWGLDCWSATHDA